MKNRALFLNDPSARKLVNEGVANVNDDRSRPALEALRYELETFVCDGQYGKGLRDILENFIKNIDQAQQPAAWVSGFFGSGKSHLVKMLRALWEDTEFEDGATARGLAHLPQEIKDLLKELNVVAKRYGGLMAASGTLGAGASGSVRLALLRIILKAAGLPENYPVAKFVLWLKREGIYDEVKHRVEQKGLIWAEELDNFYVAEGLHAALVEAKPQTFVTVEACSQALSNLYPYVQDISSDEMVKTIRQALTKKDQFPLTLIALDEVQQYIGEDGQRSIEVQEAVEACCKQIGGRLLFIATGQTAVSGTSNLKKLEGRFPVRIELSDADVDAVIRKVILAKNPEAEPSIESIMQANLGEISRHLSDSAIAHQQSDLAVFSQDYPILPVRWRFWKNALRVLDQTGTESQLRNQLKMTHEAVKTSLDKDLGQVIVGDYLYFDTADKLLQTRSLPRKVHEKIMAWLSGSADDRLKARACALVFLINKVAGRNQELGLKATVDVLADLLVESLPEGSGAIRARLPELLNNCDLLMTVKDEYRIQTEEYTAWNDDYAHQLSILSNESHRVETERQDRLRKQFPEMVGRLSITQGSSKVQRDMQIVFSNDLPDNSAAEVAIWVRDGWSIDENSVRAEARAAGNQSPTIFVFIPKRSADGLRNAILEFKAASGTLDKRGVPNSPDGIEARAAMETIKNQAELKIKEYLSEILSGTRVFKGGGQEVAGHYLRDMIMEAAESALIRLNPQFHIADNPQWGRVYESAQKGAPDALKKIGDNGEPAANPVCKEVLKFLAGGRNGDIVRKYFEAPPFGWSRDAVDGALQVLLVAGLIQALDERSKAVDSRQLERKAIGKVKFKVESTTVSVSQRLRIRQLLQKMKIAFEPNSEHLAMPEFLDKVRDLALKAGGAAPKPLMPDYIPLDQLRFLSGNDQLLAVFNQADELAQSINHWADLGKRIQERWPAWEQLEALSAFATGLDEAAPLKAQVGAIDTYRQLLDEPDKVAPLKSAFAQLLRQELKRLDAEYETAHNKGLEALRVDPNWQQLKESDRYQLMSANQLHKEARPSIDVQSADDVLATLNQWPLTMLAALAAALPARFDQVAIEAAQLCEPQAVPVTLPRRTLKTESDVDQWLKDVRGQLTSALSRGPVIVK